MDYLNSGDSVAVAASRSGLSRASGYNIVKEVKSGGKKHRARTRPDPLEGIFDPQTVSILKAVPNIRTVALWREITRLNPQLDPSVKRTFERRVRQWRGENGADKEIIFRQGKEAGRMGISDFTDAASLGVTLNGEAFVHKLYHFQASVVGFYLCPRGDWRGELVGVFRRSAKRSEAAGRGSEGVSYRQPFGGFPQPSQKRG